MAMTDEERARSRMWAAIVAAVNSQVMGGVDEAVDAFEAAIRADERENCAQVADNDKLTVFRKSDTLAHVYNKATESVAAAIRARGSE